jgi:peptide/nickel transport system ATP-binding protein
MTGFRIPGSLVLAGAVEFGGVDLLKASRDELRRIWGARIAYLPQDAASALNPVSRVGAQLMEPLAVHRGLKGPPARARATELLGRVGLSHPARALELYPHQFSGGQQQRIALAVAMVCDPDVLILDEPTTGLDVTTQARVNRVIMGLVAETGTATLYVSHNLSLLATLCDRLAIMYGGEVVEIGPGREIYNHPQHPYTAALLAAIPSITDTRRPTGIPGIPPAAVADSRCGFLDRCRFRGGVCKQPIQLVSTGPGRAARCIRLSEIASDIELFTKTLPSAAGASERITRCAETVLEITDLTCTYQHRRDTLVAVERLTLDVPSRQILGIAGESGSGKSTLLKAIVGLKRPSEGQIRFAGSILAPLAKDRPQTNRRAIQIVFQNPDATLNPRQTVNQILERPLHLFRPDVGRRERRNVIRELLESVRLPADILDRYPRHLSGGQRQRVALARAVAARPDIILCDEVTSALDVSVQARIIELLAELCERERTTLVFVTHDLGVLRSLTERIIVMEGGVILEDRETSAIYHDPHHSYTKTLLRSVPDPDRLLSPSDTP